MTALRTHRIAGHGGIGLHVADAGPEGAPPIVLLHGWSQHSMCWQKQMQGALADRFRLVAPDLRGHGASDKPADPSAYDSPEPWAGDVAAVIGALGLERPVLVGWSMGGWVICDYLRHHGDAGLAGVVLIGSSIGTASTARNGRRPDVEAQAMHRDDQPAALEAAIRFARAATAAPLSKNDLALMVGWMMLVPPAVRDAARGHGDDYRPDLARMTRPALVMQGEADRVTPAAMAEELAGALPTARRVSYPGCGHLPFWEMPVRFDADLAGFVVDARAALEEAP